MYTCACTLSHWLLYSPCFLQRAYKKKKISINKFLKYFLPVKARGKQLTIMRCVWGCVIILCLGEATCLSYTTSIPWCGTNLTAFPPFLCHLYIRCFSLSVPSLPVGREGLWGDAWNWLFCISLTEIEICTVLCIFVLPPGNILVGSCSTGWKSDEPSNERVFWRVLLHRSHLEVLATVRSGPSTRTAPIACWLDGSTATVQCLLHTDGSQHSCMAAAAPGQGIES